MKNRVSRSMILTQKLEGISKKIFERYKRQVIQYIGNKPGVYALYDEKELYYVGRASDLAKRVDQHLKDQHSALWTHFSVYLTKKMQYVHDIEAVIISIAKPKGNKLIKHEFGKERKLKDFLRKAIKESHQEELKELGLGKKGRVGSQKKNKHRPNLKNYFEKNKPLMKTYKGKVHRALLLKSGKIKYKNKLYNAPTSAAKAVMSKYYSPGSAINGWTFWFIKNSENNWVKLSDLD